MAKKKIPMKKYIAYVVAAIFTLCVCFLCGNTNAKGEDEMQIDANVLQTLQQMEECPFMLMPVDSDKYVDIHSLDMASLTLVDRWSIGQKIGELYLGRYGGYLAIARDGDRVYCAQYVNSMASADVYTHESIVSGNGIIFKTTATYYIDGTVIAELFDTPQSIEPIAEYTNNAVAILSTRPSP